MTPSPRDILLRRVDTARLRRDPAENTVALVALNEGREATPPGRARFSAAFPVREGEGALPVTVRDEAGAVVPSRLVRSEVRAAAGLPPGRVLWSLTLEFAIDALAGRTGRAYAAVYADSPASRSDDASFWEALPLLPLAVAETDCHPGDLSPIFSLDDGFPGAQGFCDIIGTVPGGGGR